ncbi:MAG: transposase [Armatimonadetes bacterium]|nr:transposase [Armatimonadota bacterium]
MRRFGITPVIPRKDNEHLRHDGRSLFDKQTYRRRSIVEQTICWLKECRRIGTRFEKRQARKATEAPRHDLR